jgi:Methyltransferase domain
VLAACPASDQVGAAHTRCMRMANAFANVSKLTPRIASATRGEARWIIAFSPRPAADWSTPIDFLSIDGDHSYEGVSRDWQEWTRHLASGGAVALHDARIEAPRTDESTGPVLLLHDDPEWVVVGETDSLAVLWREPDAQYVARE